MGVQEHSAWEQNREAAGCSQAKISLNPHEKCQKQSYSDTQHSKTPLKNHSLRNKDDSHSIHISNTERDGYQELFSSGNTQCRKAGQDPNIALKCTGISWELSSSSRQCNPQHCSCSELGSTRPALSFAAIAWGESQLRVLLRWRIPHPRSWTGWLYKGRQPCSRLLLAQLQRRVTLVAIDTEPGWLYSLDYPAALQLTAEPSSALCTHVNPGQTQPCTALPT